LLFIGSIIFLITEHVFKTRFSRRLFIVAALALGAGSVIYHLTSVNHPPTLRDYFEKDYEWGPAVIRITYPVNIDSQTLDLDVVTVASTVYMASFVMIYAPTAKDGFALCSWIAKNYRTYVDDAFWGRQVKKCLCGILSQAIRIKWHPMK
jgi:hypothetical protein